MGLAAAEYDRPCVTCGHALRAHRVGHTAVDRRDCLAPACRCEDFRLSDSRPAHKTRPKPAPLDDPGRMFDLSGIPDKYGRTG